MKEGVSGHSLDSMGSIPPQKDFQFGQVCPFSLILSSGSEAAHFHNIGGPPLSPVAGRPGICSPLE